MRTTLTIIQKNEAHICFTVHVNGASAGSLCLRRNEWAPFIAKMKPAKIWDITCGYCHGAGEIPEFTNGIDWRPCDKCLSTIEA